MVLYVGFVLSLFVSRLYVYCASDELCFVIVAFPGHLHLYFSFIPIASQTICFGYLLEAILTNIQKCMLVEVLNTTVFHNF